MDVVRAYDKYQWQIRIALEPFEKFKESTVAPIFHKISYIFVAEY